MAGTPPETLARAFVSADYDQGHGGLEVREAGGDGVSNQPAPGKQEVIGTAFNECFV